MIAPYPKRSSEEPAGSRSSPATLPSLPQGVRAPQPNRLRLPHREARQADLQRGGHPQPPQVPGHHQPGGSGLPAEAPRYGAGMGVLDGVREGTRAPSLQGCLHGVVLGLPIPYGREPRGSCPPVAEALAPHRVGGHRLGNFGVSPFLKAKLRCTKQGTRWLLLF